MLQKVNECDSKMFRRTFRRTVKSNQLEAAAHQGFGAQRHRTQQFQSSMYYARTACKDEEAQSDSYLPEAGPAGEPNLGSADWRLYRRRTWINSINQYLVHKYE